MNWRKIFFWGEESIKKEEHFFLYFFKIYTLVGKHVGIPILSGFLFFSSSSSLLKKGCVFSLIYLFRNLGRGRCVYFLYLPLTSELFSCFMQISSCSFHRKVCFNTPLSSELRVGGWVVLNCSFWSFTFLLFSS